MKKRDIFTITILLLVAWFSYYLSGISWILEMILSLIIYFLIFFTLTYIWKTIRKKETPEVILFWKYFLSRISIMLIILWGLLGSFSYYYNEVSPAKMPAYHLTNWEKEVIFQGMSHIGTQNFYDRIIQRITSNKENWYVLYYEWVRPGTEENTEKFNQALGIEFDEDLYKNFSKLYWVANQNNWHLLWLVNDLDFNVDIGIDEIMELYNDKIKDIPAQKNPAAIDINTEIVNTLAQLNDRQLKVLVYVNQSILNFIISSDRLQDFIKDNFWNKNIFDVILDERNEVLADEIINSKHKKIFITYGLLHFDWVLKILQENDKNWTIKDTQYLYPIQ